MAALHSVTVTGDAAGNVVTTVDFTQGADVTADPLFLGEPPVMAPCCTFCGQVSHELDGVQVTARGAHRFDFSAAGGYYADELEAYQR